jgi:uncharacterized membrane protein YfcA
MILTALLGALIGLVLAFTGAGGGVLSIPLLMLVLHRPMAEAAPVGLLAVGLAAAFGAAVGLRQGIVRYRAALLIGAAGMLMAPFGVWLAHRLPATPLLLGMSALLAWLSWKTWQETRQATGAAARLEQVPCEVQAPGQPLRWTAPCARALAGTGLQSGLLSGLAGVGGGFIIVPALQRHTDLDLRSVQATSLAVIALVSVSGVGAAIGHGAVPLDLALPFAGGAVVALLIGQRWSDRVPARRLKQAFALVSGLTSVLMLVRAAGWL